VNGDAAHGGRAHRQLPARQDNTARECARLLGLAAEIRATAISPGQRAMAGAIEAAARDCRRRARGEPPPTVARRAPLDLDDLRALLRDEAPR
jgi:hypothetical protein